MSVLSFPRLYFHGTMSWDPIVSNNDADNYDGVAARARLAPGETVASFRQRMIASTAQRGDWNYFGTHVCVLERAHVTGGAAGGVAAPRHGDIHGDVSDRLIAAGRPSTAAMTASPTVRASRPVKGTRTVSYTHLTLPTTPYV